MSGRKLGRQRRSFNPSVPHMRALRGVQQAPLPAALSWLHGMPFDLGMMLNGPTPGDPAALELGDCTCAALAHARQVWTYNATGQMVTIPEAWCSAPIGSTWDVPVGPFAGGHAIIGAAYDPDVIQVVSWGTTWPMSWAAFSRVCDEAYLVLDRAWIEASGKTPFGMSLTDVESAMQNLKAN